MLNVITVAGLDVGMRSVTLNCDVRYTACCSTFNRQPEFNKKNVRRSGQPHKEDRSTVIGGKRVLELLDKKENFEINQTGR